MQMPDVRNAGCLHRGMSLTAVCLAAGCAQMPAATVNYYLAETEVSIKLIRSVTCITKTIAVADTVEPTVTHSADHSMPYSIELTALKGKMSDADLKFEFYEDGRLKGVNATNTGQGEAIVKALVSFLPVVGLLNVGANDEPDCEAIAKLESKALTLTFEKKLALGDSQPQKLDPDGVSAALIEHYKLPKSATQVYAQVSRTGQQPKSSTSYKKNKDDVLLWFRDPGQATIDVHPCGNGDQKNSCSKDVTVAQFGVLNKLPLPPPRIFGKRLLGIAFTEAGRLSTVQFSSNSGVAQALSAVGEGLKSTEGRTATEKAAALKAEADIIAQQQRLLGCRADPSNCK